MNDKILDSDFDSLKERRRTLLPIWIKVFVWIFIAFGILAPILLITAIFGTNFKLSMYGLETFYPLSPLGLLIISVVLYKGVVAFGLWTEKKWAVLLAIADAILGIVICVLVMLAPLFMSSLGIKLSFRLELLLLIPYLIKMYTIKAEWNKREAK